MISPQLSPWQPLPQNSSVVPQNPKGEQQTYGLLSILGVFCCRKIVVELTFNGQFADGSSASFPHSALASQLLIQVSPHQLSPYPQTCDKILLVLL